MAAAALLLALSACGFKPLYGKDAGNDNWASTDYLAQVRILPLENRTGQIMHNLLRDRLNPKGQPGDPGYYLAVYIQERKEDIAIQRDETASRANLRVTGAFRLLNQDRSQVLFESQAVSYNSYNVLDAELAKGQLAAFCSRDTQRSAVTAPAAAQFAAARPGRPPLP